MCLCGMRESVCVLLSNCLSPQIQIIDYILNCCEFYSKNIMNSRKSMRTCVCVCVFFKFLLFQFKNQFHPFEPQFKKTTKTKSLIVAIKKGLILNREYKSLSENLLKMIFSLFVCHELISSRHSFISHFIGCSERKRKLHFSSLLLN